jgi:hypothetical protein
MNLKIIMCFVTLFLFQCLCKAQITTPEPSNLGEEDSDVDEDNEGKNYYMNLKLIKYNLIFRCLSSWRGFNRIHPTRSTFIYSYFRCCECSLC